jgi:hypothetical protein
VVVEPVLMSTEAQTEGPAIGARAGAPPWWLQAPPPWALPHPMAAGREPAGGPWWPPGPPQDQALVEDNLVERVVSRLVDILRPQLVARTSSGAAEDPQGLHAGAPEVEKPSFLEELPLASSTEVSVEDHDRCYGHGAEPVRVADLRAPAAPDPRSIT